MAKLDPAAEASAARRPVAVDLFAGAGGMSLGFEQAGFDVLAAVDNDPVHLAVHERNFPQTFPVCEDVATISAETIHAAVRKGWALAGRDGEWNGVVDCLFGGPSCQGFSDMGRQHADDERNNLVFAFAKVVRELQPRSFVMENVPGLLFPKVRTHLDRLTRQLTLAGYRLQASPPVMLDASEYGVPQRRRRVFLVGVADGVELPRLPTPTAGPTVSEALDDLPVIDEYVQLLYSDRLDLTPAMKKKLTKAGSPFAASMRQRWGAEYKRVWDDSVLTGCQRTIHAASVISRFTGLDPGAADRIGRTHRLRGSGFSPTLRAGTGRDHGSFTAARPIHHKYPRVITVREAARLHTFPDWFDFNCAKWHALREIGNAVPPRLAAAVARTVIEALGAPVTVPSTQLAFGSEELLGFSLVSAADHFGVERSLLPLDVRRP